MIPDSFMERDGVRYRVFFDEATQQFESVKVAPALRVFSFGGGVQSTAALVLAAQGKIDYQTFLFCNVGADSENPDTLRYVEEVSKPYAKTYGLELIELQKVRRSGTVDTIYSHIMRSQRSIGLPVHMSNGAPGCRACTADFKIAVCAKWLRAHGATASNPATVGLGISLDEFHRMRNDSGIPYEKLAYPLIDLRLDRAACLSVIRSAGLPPPPKSSCYFCPYHSRRMWQELRDEKPDPFAKAVHLEEVINARRVMLGKDQVYLSRKCKPLPMATSDHVQLSIPEFEDDLCESGYCFV